MHVLPLTLLLINAYDICFAAFWGKKAGCGVEFNCLGVDLLNKVTLYSTQ